ncbi:MAG TPA: FecR family protein, partial [Flavisolibacter sp.]|nr:FecR family protein [Flavisolibacter sp.]
MKNKEYIERLLKKMAAETATDEELSELAELVKNDADGTIALEIEQFLQSENSTIDLPGEEKAGAMVDNILKADKLPVTRAPKIFRINRWAAAAAVILLIGLAAYFGIYQSQKRTFRDADALAQKNDALPGGAKALLTLADGTTIVLDSAAKGTISRQGNTKVIKVKEGQLAYNSNAAAGVVLYNTISTPRGGQYQVILPDGTNVWLNAASSLRFPTAFSGTERKVELDGEGYFEVAKNAKMPFIVQLAEASIQVLGTHFNVMAYNDEADIKTTLLEGSVKINAEAGTDQEKLLKPGEQA